MLLENKSKTSVERQEDRPSDLRNILNGKRSDFALALLETALQVPRFAMEIEASEDGGRTFADREHLCLVDYLIYWLADGDPTYRALYLGERIKMAYDPQHTVAERNALTKHLLENDARIFQSLLQEAPEHVQHVVAGAFDDMVQRVAGTGERTLRVLMVGDCLHLDVMAFLTDRLGARDISILPYFVTDKNPAGVVDSVRRAGGKDFDLVFYSPFTYENGLSGAGLYRLRNALITEDRRRDLVAAMVTEAEQVARALAETFAVPIFIHNSAVLPRHTGTARERLARRLSARQRQQIRQDLDQAIDKIVTHLNMQTFPHLHKFDEIPYTETASEEELGSYLYHHGLQHPARLGVMIAEDYALIMETAATVLKKKMVVCDLDNTLWDGIIGEGDVRHHRDRQEVLKRLKAKGVVLSIASKNDPANVHWTDGVLSERDFVYSHISWAPKVMAFGEMERQLNLKSKDFVFIDDRADERAMAMDAHPKLVALDAEDAHTWAMFDLWEKMLDASPDMDRTQMYLDRAKRQAFETENTSGMQDKTALFTKLGLKLHIWQAQKKDLKRATELVNRTNQFNMTAARVTFPQMTDWASADEHGVYVASMSDNFGNMGIISVLVTEARGADLHIPVFVLSCRVFGYGAETALLNTVKDRLHDKALTRITGTHVPTEVNAPCRDTYSENGFAECDGQWVWTPDADTVEDPVWLAVTRR